MQIRGALPGDAAQLLDLIRQHAVFERATARVTEADLVAILNAHRPPTHLIVAEDEKSLIGYRLVLRIRDLPSKRLYVFNDVAPFFAKLEGHFCSIGSSNNSDSGGTPWRFCRDGGESHENLF